MTDLAHYVPMVTTITDIQHRVAASFALPFIDMRSARRSALVSRTRQIAMYLARHLTNHSLPEIGRSFGGRDHTTVMHAIKRIDEIMAADDKFRDVVSVLRSQLECRHDVL